MKTQTGLDTSRRGLSLGSALKYLGRSAMELHRYRYIRTRMLHDSLDRMDGQRIAGRTRAD